MNRQADLIFGRTQRDLQMGCRFAIVHARHEDGEITPAYMMETNVYGDWTFHLWKLSWKVVEVGSLKACRDAVSRDWLSVKENLSEAMASRGLT